MAVSFTPDSAYAREAVKWEGQYSAFGPPGRPYRFEEFPKRLYKAVRPATGGKVTFDGLVVNDADEQRNLESRGYCEGQEKALAALHASDLDIANAAAERAFSDRRMSDKAQREADVADEATASHVPSIPEKRRPGRPKRTEVSDGV